MSRWLRPLILCCFLLIAYSVHLEAMYQAQAFNQRHHTKKFIQYVFFDLGVTDLPLDAVSKHSLPLSLAPSLNNAGQVIYNDTAGGYLWSPDQGVQRLLWEGSYARFHSISNKDSTVLASTTDANGQQKWLLWKLKCGQRQMPAVINVPRSDEVDIYFRTLHDNGILSGLAIYRGDPVQDSHAIVWPGNGQLYNIGKGVAWSVSANGYALANDTSTSSNSPYLWHSRGGFLVLADHACFKKPENIRYVDMLLNYDSSVYGTFFYRDEPAKLYGFNWDPHSEKFNILDFSGMRVSAGNAVGDLVGSLAGTATVRLREGQTCDLTRLVEVKGKRWQLLEATDINDLGQIVGIGRVDGQLHAFFLQPLEDAVLKVYRKK